jgi:hypothetical protein
VNDFTTSEDAIAISSAFDYDVLDFETRALVEQKTAFIKERIRRTAQDIVDIGEDLIEVKDRLEHGQFGLWLKLEFDWDERTARRFMSVAAMMKSDTVSVLPGADLSLMDIGAGALYVLAAKSTPQEVRREALERAYKGEVMTQSKVKELVKERKTKRLRKKSSSVSRAIARLFKCGDWVVVDCPKSAGSEQSKHNGRWGRILDVGALGSVKVDVGNEVVQYMASDIQILDNPTPTFVQVAEKVVLLLKRSDLDEFERRLLTLYLQRQTFTQRQMEMLTYLVDHYENPESV